MAKARVETYGDTIEVIPDGFCGDHQYLTKKVKLKLGNICVIISFEEAMNLSNELKEVATEYIHREET